MANEADSRDTIKIPRWGETANGASVSGNVVEPSSGKKDTGWLPAGEGITGEWWNWLHWMAGVFLRYIENVFGLGAIYNALMAGADSSTEGVITNGTGLSVNVSSARVWLNGAMYKVPAAVDLALAAADPSNPRIDLVYARTTGTPAVSSYAVVTGTPSGAPAAPVLPAGGCAVGTVRVNAAGVTPSTKTSVREFGALQLDRLIARERFDVGDVGGVPAVTIRRTAGLLVGDPASPTFWAIGGDFVLLDPALFGFSGGAAITRKFDMHASHFRLRSSPAGAATLSPPAGGDGGSWLVDGTVGTELLGAVRVPKGSTITGFLVHGTRPANTGGLHGELFKIDKATNAMTSLGFVASSIGSGSTGAFTLTKTGINEIVDQNSSYVMAVDPRGGTGNSSEFWAVEVVYTQANPFDSL